MARTYCKILGIATLLMGIIGFVTPHFMGFHLSAAGKEWDVATPRINRREPIGRRSVEENHVENLVRIESELKTAILGGGPILVGFILVQTIEVVNDLDVAHFEDFDHLVILQPLTEQGEELHIFAQRQR